MHNIPNFEMSQTCSSYQEYKSMQEESKLKYLIHNKYIKVLGRFIEVMYPGLKFDIFVKYRNPKEKKVDWYGYTYMELKVFDIIKSPMYSPDTFEPYYSTPYCKERIYSGKFYKEIDDFIPEINKHLLISYRPILEPHSNYHMSWSDIPDYECWREYFLHQRRDDIKIHSFMGLDRSYFNEF